MPIPALTPFLVLPRHRREVGGGNERWRVSIASVPSGVVTGRMLRHGSNAHTDQWSLFQSREQYEACAARDPLRFLDPLMFVQMKKEFDHVYDGDHRRYRQPDGPDGRGLGDERPGSPGQDQNRH